MTTNQYPGLEAYGPREIANMFSAMTNGNRQAARTYRSVCRRVLHGVIQDNIPDPDDCSVYQNGVFRAGESLSLVDETSRTTRFLQAIRDTNARTFIDAGTGASGLLAIGTALLHPDSEGIAYEINPRAAECARRIITLGGLANRITVVTANVLSPTISLPAVDLGISETFGPALASEPGDTILRKLSETCKTLLPGRATLQATTNLAGAWTHLQSIDFATFDGMVTGLVARSTNDREAYVRMSLLTSDGAVIMDERHPDELTRPLFVGMVPSDFQSEMVRLSYRAGTDMSTHSAHFRPV